MNMLKIEFSKFTVVGTVNFIFTFIIFYALVKMALLNYLTALLITSTLGMVLTYSLNYIWVFKPEQDLKFRGRLFKYVCSGFLSIAINMMILSYIVERTGFDPFYVQFALIPFIVIFNFLTAKFWSLKPTNLS